MTDEQGSLSECVEGLLRRLQLADTQSQASPDLLHFLVDRVKNVRIEVWPNDHDPPHFHVRISGGQYCVSYRIDSLDRLAGDCPSHLEREVREWARDNQSLLMQAWDSTRPAIIAAGTEE